MTRRPPLPMVPSLALLLVVTLAPESRAQRVLVDGDSQSAPASVSAPVATPAAIPVPLTAARLPLALPTASVPGDETGASLSAAGDINGDGYSDLILSSPGHATGRGLVQTYLGGPDGTFTLNASITSAALDSRFGESVSTAGDVNNDGYDDIVVGWPLINAGVGQALVYHGGPNGIAGGSAATLNGTIAGGHFGATVAFAGHLNGDNYGDIAVGAPLASTTGGSESGAVYVYYGSAAGIAGAPTGFRGTALHQRRGAAIAGIGDMNADTYDDLLVGAPYTASDGVVGRVYVYRGSNTGVSTTAVDSVSQSTAGARFGFSVASAGDWDGDGYMDAVVGAPYAFAGGAEGGVVFLLRGAAAGGPVASLLQSGGQALAHFGWSVGCAGDVDGDGLGDVVMGEPDFDGNVGADEGRVFVRFGVRSGSSVTQRVLNSDASGARFGAAVSGVGDASGDGFTEVAVGAPGFGSSAGALYTYAGGVAATARFASTAYTLDGPSHVGQSVSTGGDFNGDGYDDAIVGVPGDPTLFPNGGSIFLFYGKNDFPTTLATVPIAHGAMAGGNYGASVAIVGDVNGDGYDDALVGAPGHTAPLAGQGAAFLLLGGAAGLDTIPVAQWLGESAGQGWGSCVAAAGDLNHDGYADLAVGSPLDDSQGALRAGRVAIYLGGPGGPALTPSFEVFGQAQDESLGVAIAAAGDVTGDGIDDLAIGAPGFDAGTGRVRIVKGSYSAPFSVSTLASTLGPAARFGASLAGRGDVDGDGIADLAVGAPDAILAAKHLGAVVIHRGALGGLSPAPSQTLNGGVIDDLFGASVAWGDLSSDGRSDLGVGSPGANGPGTDPGAVDFFLADPTGHLATPGTRLQRPQLFYRARGASLSMNGDFNGDGFADAVFGAPLSEPLAAGSGIVEFAIGGGSLTARERIERQLQWISTTPLAIGGRSNEGTSFDTAMRARTAVGREEIIVQYQTGTTTQPWASLPIQFSLVVTFGPPDPTNGCFIDMGQGMTGFAPGDGVKWRMRVRTRFPWIPSTPWFSPSGTASTLKHVLMPPSLVAVAPGPGATSIVEFAPAWPNPSNAGVTFSLRLPAAGRVELAIYDVAGRLVRDLSPGARPAGESRVTWDGADARGRATRAGVYFARLTVGSAGRSQRFVRL